MQPSEVQWESCNSLQKLSQQFWGFLCKKAHLSSPLMLAWHLAVFKSWPVGHLIFSSRKTFALIHWISKLWQQVLFWQKITADIYCLGYTAKPKPYSWEHWGLAVQACKRNLIGGGCSHAGHPAHSALGSELSHWKVYHRTKGSVLASKTTFSIPSICWAFPTHAHTLCQPRGLLIAFPLFKSFFPIPNLILSLKASFRFTP